MKYFDKKEIGIIGLGKMGSGVALHLLEKGWKVVGYNRTQDVANSFKKNGLTATSSLKELVGSMSAPRVIWMMVPSGSPVDEMIAELMKHLQKGDCIIDAGNSFYKDAKRRSELLSSNGVEFVDVGTSGGPSGARNGACLMIGGSAHLFQSCLPLYEDIALPHGFAHFEGPGAGHFVKMVHNGIEYGMMQAIGEGFHIMKKSSYGLDLKEVTRIYNTGSVIESRLIGWLKKAYDVSGADLADISGSVNATGEGEWTVKAGQEQGVPTPVIQASFEFRKQSQENPSYTGQVVSALRGQFGGHAVKKEQIS